MKQTSDFKVKRSIAELLPAGELLYTCQIAPDFSDICNDPDFWKSKLMKDYQLDVLFSDPSEYKLLYELIYQGLAKVFKIHIKDEMVGCSYYLPTRKMLMVTSLNRFLEEFGFGNVNLNKIKATDNKGKPQSIDSAFITHVYI